MTNIITSGINILAHRELFFTSANAAGDFLTRREQDIMRSQPGYNKGREMKFAFTPTSGIRLYVRVGREWMDASLADIAI